MSKITLAGNIKEVKMSKLGKTYLSVWDNWNKKHENGSVEVKQRTVMVWFEQDMMGQYVAGDFIEVEGEPGASSFSITDDQTGEPKQVAMLNINNPKVINHRMDRETKAAETARVTENIDTPF